MAYSCPALYHPVPLLKQYIVSATSLSIYPNLGMKQFVSNQSIDHIDMHEWALDDRVRHGVSSLGTMNVHQALVTVMVKQ